MSDPFLNVKDTNFLYKAKVFAGILSKRVFVGPYFAVIAGKHSCNYRCIFCEWFSPMAKELTSEKLSSDCYMDMDVYRGLVKELSELGTKIVLFGDTEEPFMDPHLIEKIKYAKQCNLGCFIITNGSLLDEENAEKIVDLKLDYLNVSINAGLPETYPKIHTTETQKTFERIVSMVSFIEKLKEKNRTDFPCTRLSMVVCNRNYYDISKFVDLCQEIGVKNAHIKRLISTSKEMAEELELTPIQEEQTKKYLLEAVNSSKKYGINLDMEWTEWTGSQKTLVKNDVPCYFGWLFTVIDADGSVRPCCFQNRSPTCTIGNIKETEFSILWRSKKYHDFRRKSKNIAERRKMGHLCNQPSCYFNNKQVYEILHKPYFFPIIHGT